MKRLTDLDGLFDSKVYLPGEVPTNVLTECVRFRNKIYIEEGYITESESTSDPDRYDDQSAHICIRIARNGRLAGYCRMIYDDPEPLPIIALYPNLMDHLDTKVEISRFSVHNLWRGKLRAIGMAPIFQLTHELLRLSRKQHIHQWSCLIDERFQKLCERFFKMNFHILGEPTLYMGSPSVPCVVKLSESIRNNLKNPDYTALWGSRDLQEWIAELEGNES